jgi:hypothetical protein
MEGHMKMLMIALVAVGMIGSARADEDVVEAPKTYVNNPKLGEHTNATINGGLADREILRRYFFLNERPISWR